LHRPLSRPWRALRRFWEHDPGLSILLGLLLLLVFVIPPFMDPGEERAPVVDAVFTLLLFAGVAGLRVGPGVRALLLVVALVAAVARWWPGAGAAATALSSAVSMGMLALVVLVQTFRGGPVSVHRVQGAVAAYLLLGLVWGYGYELVAALHPGAFASALATPGEDRSLIYFSFVTLTTVGYGDVTPVHPAARSLALMEALTGQLYPAILLARLVTLHTQGEGSR
jgi:Ion channel